MNIHNYHPDPQEDEDINISRWNSLKQVKHDGDFLTAKNDEAAANISHVTLLKTITGHFQMSDTKYTDTYFQRVPNTKHNKRTQGWEDDETLHRNQELTTAPNARNGSNRIMITQNCLDKHYESKHEEYVVQQEDALVVFLRELFSEKVELQLLGPSISVYMDDFLDSSSRPLPSLELPRGQLCKTKSLPSRFMDFTGHVESTVAEHRWQNASSTYDDSMIHHRRRAPTSRWSTNSIPSAIRHPHLTSSMMKARGDAHPRAFVLEKIRNKMESDQMKTIKAATAASSSSSSSYCIDDSIGISIKHHRLLQAEVRSNARWRANNDKNLDNKNVDFAPKVTPRQLLIAELESTKPVSASSRNKSSNGLGQGTRQARHRRLGSRPSMRLSQKKKKNTNNNNNNNNNNIDDIKNSITPRKLLHAELESTKLVGGSNHSIDSIDGSDHRITRQARHRCLNKTNSIRRLHCNNMNDGNTNNHQIINSITPRKLLHAELESTKPVKKQPKVSSDSIDFAHHGLIRQARHRRLIGKGTSDRMLQNDDSSDFNNSNSSITSVITPRKLLHAELESTKPVVGGSNNSNDSIACDNQRTTRQARHRRLTTSSRPSMRISHNKKSNDTGDKKQSSRNKITPRKLLNAELESTKPVSGGPKHINHSTTIEPAAPAVHTRQARHRRLGSRPSLPRFHSNSNKTDTGNGSRSVITPRKLLHAELESTKPIYGGSTNLNRSTTDPIPPEMTRQARHRRLGNRTSSQRFHTNIGNDKNPIQITPRTLLHAELESAKAMSRRIHLQPPKNSRSAKGQT